MKRKIRIDWQKIINESWNEDIFHVYHWLMQISKDCYKQSGWNRPGFHQTFHGYSGNNEPNEIFHLGTNFKQILYNGFVNILCKTNHPTFISDFLKKENIVLGKIRIITIDEDEIESNYYNQICHPISYQFTKINHIINDYSGLELKKENFHPNYTERTIPRILNNIYFGSNGKSFIIKFIFSFKELNYEPGWEYSIIKNNTESFSSFFDRSIQEIDNLLVDSNDCNNCPLWIKYDRGDYLRHGYRGNCRKYHKCEKTNVVKYHWESVNDRIIDNAIHDSIEFPYYTKRL